MNGLGGLIDDVSFVLFPQHIFPDEGVEVDVHKLEEDVDISFVG